MPLSVAFMHLLKSDFEEFIYSFIYFLHVASSVLLY